MNIINRKGFIVSLVYIKILLIWSGVFCSMDQSDAPFTVLTDQFSSVKKAIITSIAIHPTQSQIAYGYSFNNELSYCIDESNGSLKGTLGLAQDHEPALVGFSADGLKFVAAGGSCIQLGVNGIDKEKQFPRSIIQTICFSANSQYLFMATSNDQTHILSAYNVDESKQLLEEPLCTLNLSHKANLLKTVSCEQGVEKIVYSSDPHELIFSQFDGSKVQYENLLKRDWPVSDIQFNEDGTYLALVHANGIQVIKPKDGAILYDLTIINAIPCCIECINDYLVCGTQQGELVHVNLKTVKNNRYFVGIHTASTSLINIFASDQDGSRFVWGGGTVSQVTSLKEIVKRSHLYELDQASCLDVNPEKYIQDAKRKKCKKRALVGMIMTPITVIAATFFYYGLSPFIKAHG